MNALRFLEMLPGILLWLTLILPFAFSFSYPRVVAFFMIFYTTIWLLRSFGFSFFLLRGYFKARQVAKVDWNRALNSLSHTDFIAILSRAPKETRAVIEPLYQRYQKLSLGDRKSPQDLLHIVLIPTYKEEVDILRHSIQSIADSHFDLKKIIVALATEERDAARARQNSALLLREFKEKFKDFWVFEHPADLPDEIPCKGSNIYHAGRQIKEKIRSLALDPSSLLVTTIDADNLLHPEYLACLSLHYLTEPERKQRSYQSLPLFFNNIWNVPIFNRLVAVCSSFWHLIQSGRPKRLRNFAAHSQPLDALIEMDFWNKNSIVEDGHQFWRAYFHFKGEHRVVPLFVPIYQDAVQLESYWQTLKAQYLQLRRWAWGASDIAFVIVKLWENRKTLPFWRTLRRLFVLIEGHYMWATAPLIIMLAAPLPDILNEGFKHSVEAYNLSFIFGLFFKFALSGIIVAILVTLTTLPKHPQFKWRGRLELIFIWILLPLTTIIFGAIPSIEAQTRLMLGKRLDFNVTEKIRKYDKISSS